MTPEDRETAMRCDEIQEQFVDLLYDEKGTPSPGQELLEHLRSCSACQSELAGLKELQATLKVWQDEPPLRHAELPRRAAARHSWFPIWNFARYAAVAVLLALAFLSLSNAQIKWDKDGFAFRTSLFSRTQETPAGEFYTKDEVNAALIRVLNISQDACHEEILQGMSTQDADWAGQLRAVTQQIRQNRSRN